MRIFIIIILDYFIVSTFCNIDAQSIFLEKTKDISGIRFLSFYENEGTLYIGTYEGLFNSTDKGNTWTYLGLKGEGVLKIGYSKITKSIYVGTWNGIYKKSGTDWLGIAKWTSNFALDSKGYIYINGNDTLIDNHSLIRSSDNGVTWETILSNYKPSIGFISIDSKDRIFFTKATRVGMFLSCGVMYSNDYGMTWNQSNPAYFGFGIADMFIDSDDNVLVSAYSQSYVSTDHGVSWQERIFPTEIHKYGQLGKHILALNSVKIYRSGNFFATWDNIDLPSYSTSFVAFATEADSIILIGFTNNPDIYKSTDFGKTWEKINDKITSIGMNDVITKDDFSLDQNYPNPFNPSTIITFEIPKSSFVTLDVYDILGRKISTLVQEEKPGGKYNVQFNANKLSSGIYIYTLRTKDFMQTKKMILIK